MFDLFTISHQGGRPTMEDFSFLIENFGDNKNWILGGVFDGHGGPQVAKLAASLLPNIFLKKIKCGESVSKAFSKTYKEISEPDEFTFVGSTALSFFIKGKTIYVANAGDSRMIMITKKGIRQLTNTHNFKNVSEKERVLSSGGQFDGGYLIKEASALAPTRSLGDHYFRDVGLIAEPEITTAKITGGVEFIAATDGLWNELGGNEEVVEIARRTGTAKEAAVTLLDHILQNNSEEEAMEFVDNISIIAIKTINASF